MLKHVIITGTPGRLIDHIEKHTIDLEQIKFFIRELPRIIRASSASFHRNSWSSRANQEVLKLYFNEGKKKIRAVDFVGTIAKIDGVSVDDIGIITIEDKASYVDILNGKGHNSQR